MKTCKFALVGCDGIMKWVHIPALAKIANVEVVAMCDSVEGRCEEIKKFAKSEYGTNLLDNARCYTSYDEMLEHESLDAVDICTPNYLHAPFAIKALEKGIHAFSEKPDCTNVEDMLRMKEAAEKSGKVLMVMRNNRYNVYAQMLKKRAESGEFGTIYCGRCGWIRRRGIPGKGGWFTTKEYSGGGPLIDLGVHMIDLAIYLMGNPKPVAVSGAVYCNFANDTAAQTGDGARYGEAKKDGIFDVEDQATGFIRFDNGAALQIDFSWAGNIEAENFNFLELRGSKAGMKWKDSGKIAKVFKEVDGEQVDETLQADTSIGGHEANLRHFVDVISSGAKPDYTPQQGLDMIKILTAIYRSAETGREVVL